MSLGSIFASVPQSKLAGLTILITLGLISIFILVGKDKISFGQKIAIVLLLILLALPTILLTLFQINCVVTGAGKSNQRWWCSLYAWIVALLIVLYCVMLILVSLTSFSKGDSILAKDAAHKAENVMTREFFKTMEESEEEDMPSPEEMPMPEDEKDMEPEPEPEPETMEMPRIDVMGQAKKLLKNREGFKSNMRGKKHSAPKKSSDTFVDYDGPMNEVKNKEESPIEGFVCGGYAAY